MFLGISSINAMWKNEHLSPILKPLTTVLSAHGVKFIDQCHIGQGHQVKNNFSYGHSNCMHWTCNDIAAKQGTAEYHLGCFKAYVFSLSARAGSGQTWHYPASVLACVSVCVAVCVSVP